MPCPTRPDWLSLVRMHYCERCNNTRAWVLGDGRYKCSHCGYRYSWTSAWDAVRLPAAAKDRLLESFVLGLPSYRQRFLSPVNAKTRERFYRICRACCADAEQVRLPLLPTPARTGFGTNGKPRERLLASLPQASIEFELIQLHGEIKAAPVTAENRPELLRHTESPGPDGSLYHAGAQRAYICLPLRGNYVVLQADKYPAHDLDPADGVAGFWRFARRWLRPYHALPRQYFHLYLGEICYRFNRRDQELRPLLRQLLQQRSIQELRPLLEAAVAAQPEKIAAIVPAPHFLRTGRVAGQHA